MRRAALFLMLFMLALALAPRQAGAQQQELTLSASALYDGTTKYGEWLPILVQMENQGADVRGRVQVRVSGSGHQALFAQQLELPRGGRKQVTIYTVPNNFSRRVTVEFVPEDGDKALVEQQVDIRPVPNIRFMAAVVTSGGEGLDALAGINFRGEQGRQDEAVVVPLTLDTLPDRPEALRTLDLLILSGIDTADLSPTQQAALEQYVALGGLLALGGGPEAGRVLAGVPASLAPVTLAGEASLETLPSLGTVTGEEIRVSGPFPAARGEPVAGASARYSEGDLPLVVERPVGAGIVYWFALDPALSPFDAWAGTDEFWQAVIGTHALYPSNLPPDVSPRQAMNEQLFYALQNLPSLDLPSLRLLVPLLAIYILMVGPVNYFLLRRTRRMELAWVTIPIITLLFSAGAYGIGFQLRGSDIIVNQISLVRAVPGGEGAYVRSLIGVFSPSRRSYDLAISGQPLLSPTQGGGDPFSSNTSGNMGEAVIIQGEPALVRNLTVNQWSMQSVAAELLTMEQYGLESDIQISGQKVEGTITNDGEHHWQDVVVVLGSRFERVGDIAPGESKDFSLEKLDGLGDNVMMHDLPWRIFQAEMGPRGPGRTVEIRQQILSSLLNNPAGMAGGSGTLTTNRPLLLAWLDAAPTQIELADQTQLNHVSTTLLYSQLPVQFSPGELTVPRGMLESRIIQVDGSTCYGGNVISLAPDFREAELHFELPAEVKGIDPTLLTLYLTTDGGMFGAPQVELYDFTAGEWSQLAEIKEGRNQVQEPDVFLSKDGLIRLRVQNEDRSNHSCMFFDVSVDGEMGREGSGT